MEQSKLTEIGYRKHYYGSGCDSDTKQCFHCKYGKTVETDRDWVRCSRWNMTVGEDDICNYFEFATYWAFDCTEEDNKRRRLKLENAKRTAEEKSKVKPQEGCYIATAVYGGYDQPEVLVLRRYRDEVLKKTFMGRIFIKTYYFISPCLAKRLKKDVWVNEVIRNILDRFVKKLEK